MSLTFKLIISWSFKNINPKKEKQHVHLHILTIKIVSQENLRFSEDLLFKSAILWWKIETRDRKSVV